MSMQGFRRFMATAASVVVGAASFALSFVALRDVSVELEAVPPSLGWLVPIVIDGGVICGSAIIWSLSHEQRRRPVFPFLFVGSLVMVSVVVNAAHAGPTILAKLIASLPPLILLGTLELVAGQGRRHTASGSQGEPVATTALGVTPTAREEAGTAETRVYASQTTLQIPTGPVAPAMTSEAVSLAITQPVTQTHSPAMPVVDSQAPIETAVIAVELTSDTDFDTELESAVEEALAPATEWARPEQGTYNRTPGNTSQGRRRTARVRAEGPTF